MEMLSQKQKFFVVIGLVIVVLVIIFCYFSSTKEEDFDELMELEESNNEEKKVSEDKIIVHVTGAVNNEGIVEVKENARINDVIVAAGGLTDNADLSHVNLAYLVEDGQKIYIPSKDDILESEFSEDELAITDAGKGVIKEYEDNIGSGNLININNANKDRLKDIPGIGEATAEKIITYREENGKFKNIEDIKNVSGIGEKKYEAIKSYICVWIIMQGRFPLFLLL